jgi:hypothetical protein
MNCPFCAEPVPGGATRCTACGESLTARPAQATGWGSPDKPVGIIIIAALDLLFGAMGLFGLVMSAFMFLVLPRLVPGGGPGFTPGAGTPFSGVMSTPAYHAFMGVSAVVGGVFAIVQLGAGLGLVQMRTWGRTLALAYGWGNVVWIPLATLLNVIIVVRPMLEEGQKVGGPAAFGAQFGAAGAIGGACFGSLLPIATLIVMNRENVVAAFEKAKGK